MRKRDSTLTDRQVDDLLAGHSSDAELATLTETITALRSLRPTAPEPSDDFIARVAASAREGASRHVPRPLPTRSRTWKMVPAAAAAALAITSVAPLAALADTSAPSDVLYSVDLLFERFGIGAGGLAERLDEVETLTERGDVDTARRHLQTSVGVASDAELTMHAGAIEAATEDLATSASDVPSTPARTESPNRGPGNNSGNADPGPGEDNPNKGTGNNSGDQENPNAGPGANSGNPGNSGEDPNKGPGNPDGNQGNPDGNQGNPDGNQGNPDGNQGNPDGNQGQPNPGAPGKGAAQNTRGK